MSAILTQPVGGRAAWSGRELAGDDAWIERIESDTLRELDAALNAARACREVEDISPARFPLPHFASRLARFAEELESGRGFVLLRGLPRDRYADDEVARIFWGIGSYLGKAVPQNARGDFLGHVRDEGFELTDPRARGYQTRAAQSLHVDRCDVVGLLCMRKAKSGGISRVVSSMRVYDEMLRRCPQLIAPLYKAFAVDLREEQPPGEPAVYYRPVFSYYEGRLSCGCNYTYVRAGQERIGTPLSGLETEALDAFYAVAEELVLEMDLQPGDMQFLNNYVTLHDRTGYEDHQEPERKRHMLRLWLTVPNRRALAPDFGSFDFETGRVLGIR